MKVASKLLVQQTSSASIASPLSPSSLLAPRASSHLAATFIIIIHHHHHLGRREQHQQARRGILTVYCTSSYISNTCVNVISGDTAGFQQDAGHSSVH
jgi:hypothetical protein